MPNNGVGVFILMRLLAQICTSYYLSFEGEFFLKIFEKIFRIFFFLHPAFAYLHDMRRQGNG